ncbi:MAG: uracil-DNA glycosylase [Dehalococcoidia bacterium]|nr:uracil-DNA glycosylase [Dehalococcoidia bacterium]
MSQYDLLVSRITNCTSCGLSDGRTNAVPGSGSLDADIMFIGEGPGFHEDRQGVPFVGQAGNLLNHMLSVIGLSREDDYITNMVKCRPPNNRDPFPGELEACAPYLDEQLELINPKVIVTLGRFSFTRFFPGQSIGRSRGKPRKWREYMVFPMYHPAAALHNPGLRPVLEDDFAALPGVIEQVIEQRTGEPEPEEQPAQQLSMFE